MRSKSGPQSSAEQHVREMSDLKEALADVLLENRLLEKSMIGDGDDHE
jgi:hypothetical protein